MIYDVTWTNLRKEYQQTDEHQWKWVTKVDVAINSLAFSATVELPAESTAATATNTLKASAELKALVSKAKQANTSTAFQLTIEDPK